MKIYFLNDGAHNNVILTDGITAKIFYGLYDGKFQNIDLYSGNVIKRLRKELDYDPVADELGGMSYDDFETEDTYTVEEVADMLGEATEITFDREKEDDEEEDEEPTEEELAEMEKMRQVREKSRIGRYGDTFRKSFDRIPEEIYKKLAADEVAELVDAFCKCYGDGMERRYFILTLLCGFDMVNII